MTVKAIANQICTFFGGPYDATTHTYRSPQITVANLSPVFRRAAPKRDDHQSDYWAIPVPPTPVGCLVGIFLEAGSDKRLAPGTPGIREVEHTVHMHAFLRAEANYAEDAQDAEYDLLEAIYAKLLTDRTAGSGGIEAGFGIGFQVGEVSSGQPWFRWQLSPVQTTPRELSKAYLHIEFDAVELRQA